MSFTSALPAGVGRTLRRLWVMVWWMVNKVLLEARDEAPESGAGSQVRETMVGRNMENRKDA